MEDANRHVSFLNSPKEKHLVFTLQNSFSTHVVRMSDFF